MAWLQRASPGQPRRPLTRKTPVFNDVAPLTFGITRRYLPGPSLTEARAVTAGESLTRRIVTHAERLRWTRTVRPCAGDTAKRTRTLAPFVRSRRGHPLTVVTVVAAAGTVGLGEGITGCAGGAAKGVTGWLGADSVDVPTALVAVTVTV